MVLSHDAGTDISLVGARRPLAQLGNDQKTQGSEHKTKVLNLPSRLTAGEPATPSAEGLATGGAVDEMIGDALRTGTLA
jgi:hypothetical protein